MEPRYNHIEKLFYASLSNMESKPSAKVWEQINAELDKMSYVRKGSWQKTIHKMAIITALMLPPFTLYEFKMIKPGEFIISQPASHYNSVIKPTIEKPYIYHPNTAAKHQRHVVHITEQETELFPMDYPGVNINLPQVNNKLTIPSLEKIAKPSFNKQIPLTQINSSRIRLPGRKEAWTLSLFGSGDLSSYRLANSEMQIVNGQSFDDKDQLENRENHEPSFSAGLLLSRKIKQNIFLQSGIIYAANALSIEPYELYAVQKNQGGIAYKLNTSSGYVYVEPAPNTFPEIGDSLSIMESQHNLEFLTIPLIVQFKMQFSRWSVLPAAGFTANFLMKAHLKTEMNTPPYNEKVLFSHLQGLKTFHLGITGSIDLRYSINDKISLDITPTYRYALTPITRKTALFSYPVNYGIAAGVSYSFLK